MTDTKGNIYTLSALKQVGKFLALFFLFYYTCRLVIGISTPGNYYISFVAKYLDYIALIRKSLIYGAEIIAHCFGYVTEIRPGYWVRVVYGRGVIVSYSCVGYGVYSFWCAYVISVSSTTTGRKLRWIFGGLLLLWLINVLRIGLFLVSLNKRWPMPFGLDQHTIFNILAYTAIFVMIFFHEKSLRNSS